MVNRPLGSRLGERRNDYLSKEEMHRIQGKRLQAMVSYAYARSRFWRDWFDSAKVKPGEIQGPEDLRRMPPCSKVDLLSRPVEDRLTTSLEDCVRLSTSGTTGPPMPVYLDRSVARDYRMLRSTRIRYRHWTGSAEPIYSKFLQIAYAHAPNPVARIGVNPSGDTQGGEEDTHRARNQMLGRTGSRIFGPSVSRLFNHFVTTAFVSEDMGEVIPTILGAKPDVIQGAISYLRLLADFAADNKIADRIRPARFITSGEPVDEPNRKYIESVFRRSVYQGYGSNEAGLISFECSEKKGMHVIADKAILEILDDGGNPVSPGKAGHMVATCLVNRAMPLIRYKMGDIGYMSPDGPCRCGISLPVLESVEGRAAHYLSFPNGHQISPKRMLTILHGVAGLPRSQVVQDAPDSLNVKVFAQGKPVSRDSVDEVVGTIEREVGEPVSVRVSIQPAQRLAVKFSASVPFSQTRRP